MEAWGGGRSPEKTQGMAHQGGPTHRDPNTQGAGGTKKEKALAAVAQWIEHQQANHSDASLM